MLTLSEQALLRRHGYNIEVEEIRRAWEDEKDSLLAAINSLKELLAETHKGRDASKVRVFFFFTFFAHYYFLQNCLILQVTELTRLKMHELFISVFGKLHVFCQNSHLHLHNYCFCLRRFLKNTPFHDY